MNKKLTLIIGFIFILASIPIVQPSLAKISFKNQMITSTSAIKLINDKKNKGNLTTTLHVGQSVVGNVTVWTDSSFIFVKYSIIAIKGYKICETHLDIETNFADIPQIYGNPLPNKFKYQNMFNPTVTEFTYKIQNDFNSSFLYIAANAIVSIRVYMKPLEYVEAHLPDTVSVIAVHATSIPPYNQSYFKETITGHTYIDGVYKGWCVDLDHNMIDNKIFTANVYSTYENIPNGTVDKPWNLDLVNYIINQNYVGKQSQCDGNYTFGDVQRAIWSLIENNQSDTYYLGPWEQCRVDEILADANANGEGYYPCCNNPGQIYKVAIILQPVNISDGQVSIIEFTIPCDIIIYQYLSAWGGGLPFPGGIHDSTFFVFYNRIFSTF